LKIHESIDFVHQKSKKNIFAGPPSGRLPSRLESNFVFRFCQKLLNWYSSIMLLFVFLKYLKKKRFSFSEKFEIVVPEKLSREIAVGKNGL
jgi:hypothetical protein